MWTARNIAFLVAFGGAGASTAFLGCQRHDSGAAKTDIPSSPSAESAAIAVTGAATTSSAMPSANAPLMPLGNPASAADLFTRLQAERDHRPGLQPSADSVFATMANKLGVDIEEHLQVAGFVVGARFCDKVRTKKDVHVVVCEYADEPAAIKGVTYAENSTIRGREVLRNRATTCAVHQADGKTGASEAAQIKALFKGM